MRFLELSDLSENITVYKGTTPIFFPTLLFDWFSGKRFTVEFCGWERLPSEISQLTHGLKYSKGRSNTSCLSLNFSIWHTDPSHSRCETELDIVQEESLL